MADIKIYFSEDLHTGNLQEASRDLLEQNLKVTDKCIENLRELSPILSSDIVHSRVRQYVDPYYVTEDIVSKWNKKESWVTRMLAKTKIISYPEKTDMKLGEHLYSIDRFASVGDALEYFYSAETRLNYLISIKSPEHLSSLKYGAYAFAESRVLRKAVFQGVFLTNHAVYTSF